MVSALCNLALITARGGSKRIPSKNKRLFCGKPLIAWTIEAALGSNKFDKVIVSTDCPEIAAISEKFGASIPFIRPSCLAKDDATSHSVVNHCLKKIPNADRIMLLQPTSPLRKSNHIVSAFHLMEQLSAPSVVSVSRRPANPSLRYVIEENLLLNVQAGNVSSAPKIVSVNGAIYLFLRSWFVKNQKFVGFGTRALLMSANESVDIDTKEDWLEAEKIYRFGQVEN